MDIEPVKVDEVGLRGSTCTIVQTWGEVRRAAFLPGGSATLRWGFIDKTGKFAIPAQYELVSDSRNGLCFVELVEEIGYIDHEGNLIWRAPYVDVGLLSRL